MAGKLSFLVEVDSSKGIAEINRTGSALKSLGNTGQAAGETAAGALEKLFNHTFRLNQALELAERAFRYFISPIEKLVNIGANFETLRLQLDTVLQSAQKGKEYFEWIQQFAAKTPFRMEELTKAVITMENFGINAKKNLETVANAAAATGNDMNELSVILGKIYVKPKASMEEMLQLIERRIPVTDILNKKLGLTAEQVQNIATSGISGQKVFDALIEGMKEKYAGAIDKMAKSWSGLWSTFTDNINIALGKVAAPLIENLKGKLNNTLLQLDKWAKDGTLNRWAAQAVNLITGFIDAISTAAKTLWALKDIIITVGEAWAIGFALNKLTPLFKGLDNISTYYKILRLEGGTVFSSLTGATGETIPLLKTLGGQITGIGGMLKALPAIGVAAFAGWQIGRLIGEITGLDNVMQDFWEKTVFGAKWTVDELHKFSEKNAGISEHAMGLRKVRDEIIEVGKAAGITSPRFSTLALEIFKNKEAFDRLTDAQKAVIMAQVQGNQKLLDGIEANKKAKEADEKASLAKMAATAALKEEQAEIVKAAQKLGFFSGSTADLDKQTRILTGAVKLSGDQFGLNKEAANKVIKEVDDLKAAYLGMGKEVPPALQKIANQLKDKSLDSLVKSLDEFKNKGKALIAVWETQKSTIFENTAATTKYILETDKLAKSLGSDLDPKLKTIRASLEDTAVALGVHILSVPKLKLNYQALVPTLEQLNNLWKKAALDEHTVRIKEAAEKLGFMTKSYGELNKELQTVQDVFQKNKDQLGKNSEATQNLHAWVDKLIAEYKLAGMVVPPELLKIDKALEQIFSAMNSFGNVLNQVAKAIAPYGTLLSQAAGQLGDLGIISESVAKTMEGVGKGIGTIVSGVENFNKIGGSIFDKISGGLSIITGAISIAINLFSGLFKRDWEGEASLMLSSFGGATDEMKKKLAELAKEMGNTQEAMNKLMGEFISEANITNRAQFLTWLRGVYGLLNEAKNNGSIESIENLNNAFKALAEKGESLGFLGAEFQTLVARIRASGIEIESLTAFINGQLTKATAGLQTYIQAGINSQLQFQTAANMTISLFNTLIANGVSRLDAFSKMKDIFQSLFDSAVKSGYQMSSAFRELYDFQQKIAKNQGLIDSIKGLNDLMTGLANSGIKLSQQAFNDFAFSANDTYKQLLKAGFSGSEALSMMVPVLQNLRDMAARYNLTIDDGTQALINQATEQGFLSEKTRSDTSIIIDLLARIGDALGADIPEDLRNLVAVTTGTVDAATVPVKNWKQSWNALGDEISGIPEIIDNYGNKNTEVTDKVVEQNQDVIKNLTAIGSAYYMNSTALEVFGIKYQGFNLCIAGTEAIVDKLAGGFESALFNMGGDTQKMAGLIDDLASRLGITLPNTLTDLEGKYKYVMAAMAAQTENYFLGPDGVLRSLLDTLAYIGQQTSGEGGSNYGVYTEAQKQEQTVKYFQMTHLWGANKNTILSSESNMKKFLDDLQNLHVTDAAKPQYERFLASMRQWYAHLAKGEKWDGSKWIPGENSGGGEPNFGIYTEAQKQAMTNRMNAMAVLWQNKKDDIFARESNFRSYYNELEGLVVIPSAKSKWDNLMNAAKAAQKHFDDGDTWDPVKDVWNKAVHAAKGAHFTVPTYLQHLPMVVHPGERVDVWTADETANMYDFSNYPSRYIPAPSNETNSNQDAPVKETVIEKGDTHYHSDNRQYTIYVPTGTSANDKETFKRTLLEVLEDNYGQAASKAGVYINEWGGR